MSTPTSAFDGDADALAAFGDEWRHASNPADGRYFSELDWAESLVCRGLLERKVIQLVTESGTACGCRYMFRRVQGETA